MESLKTECINYGVIKNGAGGGARDTIAVAMEAVWKGQCCGREQTVCFSFLEASGHKPLAKTIVTRCQQCSGGERADMGDRNRCLKTKNRIGTDV